MLVYTRKNSSVDCKANGDSSKQAEQDIPTPPPRVLKLINSFNAAHDEACEAHAKKFIFHLVLKISCVTRFPHRLKEAKVRFDELRRKVMDIYRAWSVSNTNEVRVICPWSTFDF
jgi:hypothetical protein